MATIINMTAQRRTATIGVLNAIKTNDLERKNKNLKALAYIKSQGTFIQCAAFTGFIK